VVEGTVQRWGERLRISAQLLHAPTDTHLWAESYDRDLRDVLAPPGRTRQAIAREVQAKLTPQERAHFAQVHPVDPEAYEAILRVVITGTDAAEKDLESCPIFPAKRLPKTPTYAVAYAGSLIVSPYSAR